MSSVNSIFSSFRLTEKEYEELDKDFGRLCGFITQELKRKNSRNNYTDEVEDVMQEIRMAVIKAGCYYKRQTYIKECLAVVQPYVKDHFLNKLLKRLNHLWENRRRHGANKQKFGEYQEHILQQLVDTLVPETERPQKKELKLDKDFSTYCKSIAWNQQKNIGKKITRERSIRSGLISLSEFDYLCV